MNDKKSFWTTLPGILTGFGTLISAIAGLLYTLNAIHILPVANENKTAPPVVEEKKFHEQESPRVVIGLMVQPVGQELARNLGLDELTGALVEKVVAGSPAEEAGIRSGDIILKLNQHFIENPGHLLELVSQTRPGQQVEIQVIRDGKKRWFILKVRPL